MPTGKGVIGDSRGTRFKIYIYNNIGMVSPCPEVYRFAMHKHYLIFNNVMYYVFMYYRPSQDCYTSTYLQSTYIRKY